MVDLDVRPGWWRRARCLARTPERFFPADGDLRAAKAFCAGCTARVECLVYGLEECDGVWGGLGRRERRRLVRLRGRLETYRDDPAHAEALVDLIAAGIDQPQLEAVCGLDPAEVAELVERCGAGQADRQAAEPVCSANAGNSPATPEGKRPATAA